MNFKTCIQLFSGHIIYESDIDKQKKIELLNFVENANEYEVMALLLDGEPQNISEQSKPIVFERFRNSNVPDKVKYFIENDLYLYEGRFLPSPTAVLTGLGVISYFLGRTVTRQIKGLLNKCYKQCKPVIKDSYRFNVCKLTCEIKAHEKQIDEMKKINCNKRDKPKECKEKVNKTIKKLQSKIKDKKEKLSTIKGEMK